MIRRFESRDLAAALAFAAEGGQALHVHRIIVDRTKAPAVFKAAISRGESIAHFFDQDWTRLIETVRNLGVRVVKVERPRTPRQHVDLCGMPLRRVIELCEKGPTP